MYFKTNKQRINKGICLQSYEILNTNFNLKKSIFNIFTRFLIFLYAEAVKEALDKIGAKYAVFEVDDQGPEIDEEYSRQYRYR